MPNNVRIIKDGEIINNEWVIVTGTDDSSVDFVTKAKSIISLDLWKNHKDTLSTQLASQALGLFLHNDQDLADISDDIQRFDVIAIEFPVFMDGRGFSIARLLRDRYHYKGELRATGAIIRDQLCYLKRSGFNAFDMDEDIDLDAALSSLNDFTESYQTSADQPTPLFRRKAS